ncbi:polyketide synthase [Favolaschia claudopus]|uniref:Polyketide synthase n=1 Tax=Favolaschia claudopus TaxID=2862362 RepID=A0AAW0CVX8_9AGAR
MESDGIAIVGIALQLPSGSSSVKDLDYDSFWDFLVEGKNAYQPSSDILPNYAQTHPTLKFPERGTFLKDATGFDNIALGISTKDARVIPYSGQRLLDLSFQALLDAGIDSRGQNIGCFMSGNRPLPVESPIDPDGSVSSWMPHSIANRISYALDLTGPSVYLDTACSSSLTALHLAVGAIERGDCVAALVGAAQINRDPYEWASYMQAGGILSSDGVCRPFDATASGFGRGEGVVVIVLKSFKAAILERDHIYGVIRGSAINTTGSRMPPNVPNSIAQQRCIYEAYKRAGLNPRDADYVELHATGTPVGDPIEANTAGRIFASEKSIEFGSVKGNIGHLEVAAFLASLAKACLMFKHGFIPPTVNFSDPNPNIEWDAFHVNIPAHPTPLRCRSASERSIISLSSFALGGATGHVVLQAPPPNHNTDASGPASTPVLFLVGGLSSSVVDEISQRIMEIAATDATELTLAAVTLARRARQLPWRKFFLVPAPPHRSTMPTSTLIPRDTSPLVFVFSGQGPQHLEMGRELFAHLPVFRRTVLELDDIYRRVQGVSLIASTGLFEHRSAPGLQLPDSAWPVRYTLPAIAIVQIALVDLLNSVGIRPDMMLGHSAGETVALYASGAGPKEMAMEIAIARGEAMSLVESGNVGMAVLACNSTRASELISVILSKTGDLPEVSCYNAPEAVTVSGTACVLDDLITLAKREGIFAQRLRTMVPVHSSFMESIHDKYLAKMEDIFARYPGSHVPKIPVYSTCRSKLLVESFTPSYFWDNCRNPVQFSNVISHLLPSSPIFVEISCHPVLSSYISSHSIADNHVMCPMRRPSARKAPPSSHAEVETFLTTLGSLSLLGVNSLDFSGIYGSSDFKPEFIEHPLQSRDIPPPKTFTPSRSPEAQRPRNGPLSGSGISINKRSYPSLSEYVVNGKSVLPVTVFIELLLESGATFLWDVEFVSNAVISATLDMELRVQNLDSVWSIKTVSDSGEQEHSRGFLDRLPPNPVPPALDCERIMQSLPALDLTDFYPSLGPVLKYGPEFQRILRCHGTPAEIIVEIRGPSAEEIAQGHFLHPLLLDACIHIVNHPSISKLYTKNSFCAPSRFDQFVFYRRSYGSGNWFSHIRLREWNPDYLQYDVLIADWSGVPFCELFGLQMRKFNQTAVHPVSRRFDLVFQPLVIDTPLPLLPTSFPELTIKEQVNLLYTVLDALAVTATARSLDHGITVGDDVWFRNDRYLALMKSNSSIPIDADTLQSLRDKWPYHFEVTNRITAVHKAVFETSQAAVDVLYSDDLMANYYAKESQTSTVCKAVAKGFNALLNSLRASGKRCIRVLEVGAGTGLLTSYLLQEIEKYRDLLFEYTVTDASYALVTNLTRKLKCDFMIPRAYDIGKEPHGQGISVGTYDLVVALHVLHASPDLASSLSSLHNILVPGGCLLAVEHDGTDWANSPGSAWTDFIFGSFTEWFGFVDAREHCIMSPLQWKQHLEAVGFCDVQLCIENGGYGREFFFAAQKPRALPITTKPVPLEQIYSYELGQEMQLQRQLMKLDPSITQNVYILATKGRDADAAIGLCAVLRQEMALWDIRLCIFPASEDFGSRQNLLARHSDVFNNGESVVSFDDIAPPQVLRVALSPPPSETQLESDVAGWDSVTVAVTQWAGLSQRMDVFTGQIIHSQNPGWTVGEFVQGLAAPSTGSVRIRITYLSSVQVRTWTLRV